MTPQEKAAEITLRYYDLGKHLYIPINFAQQCALIVVDELINYSLPASEYGGVITDNTKEYWQEVKQEINKL